MAAGASGDEGSSHGRAADGVTGTISLRLTLECFLWQILQCNTSCREVVRQVQTLLRLAGQAPIDENNSAYVQARGRLPVDRLQQLLPATARAADRRSPAGGTLRGRPVKAADGSSAQVPDTPGNQQRFPQPSRQKPGCGFPVVRFVALFSLVSGAILDVVWGSLHHHDLSLFHELWDSLCRGDNFGVANNFALRGHVVTEYPADTRLVDEGVRLEIQFDSADRTLDDELALDDALDNTLLVFAGTEILSGFDVALVGAGHYRLSVVRARYDTKRQMHPAGEEVFVIRRADHLHAVHGQLFDVPFDDQVRLDQSEVACRGVLADRLINVPKGTAR